MMSTIPLVLERDNINDETVVLVRWFAKHGDRVEAEELIAEVETSKANVEVFAPQAGFLIWSFPEGADVPVSTPIGHISAVSPASRPQFDAKSETKPISASPHEMKDDQLVPNVGAEPPSGAERTPASSGPAIAISRPYRQRFSPVAMKMMEAHGLSAEIFAGKSAVRKQDVLDFLSPPATDVELPLPVKRDTAAAKIAMPFREFVPSRMKRAEVRSLAVGAGNSLASSVSVNCLTLGLRGSLDKRNKGINASAVIVFEVSRLLRKYPNLNGTYRDEKILQYEQVNLGYAMDDGRGLKVAVLQNCDTLSTQQISTLLRELTEAYVEDKLTPAQIANATFTISDLSGLGVSSFYPLISENQGAILGVGGEQFTPGNVYGSYTLTLTFDHQLCDGRTAALFLNDLKSRLQGHEGARPEMFCLKCGRTADQLANRDSSLLLSFSPDGYLCTLCAAGY